MNGDTVRLADEILAMLKRRGFMVDSDLIKCITLVTERRKVKTSDSEIIDELLQRPGVHLISCLKFTGAKHKRRQILYYDPDERSYLSGVTR